MAIVQEDEGNSGSAAPASTDASLPSPTTAGSGRYLIIIVACDATVPTPAGFSRDHFRVDNAGHYVFRKSAANGEDTWTITPSVPAALSWWAAEVSELDPTSPLDQVAALGTGSAGTTQSTGTTPSTTTDTQLAIASFSSSVGAGVALVTATGFTNSFVEIADTFTTRTTGTDVGLAVATKDLVAQGAQECTVTWSTAVDRTGIMVTYKVVASAPNEGQVALTLDLALATTGARDSAGQVAAGLDLALATTGSSPNGGVVALGLELAVASTGARDSAGQVAAGLVLTVAADGATTPLGQVAAGLALAVAATGNRPSSGQVAAGLVLTVSVTGASGNIGHPVLPFPWPPEPVSGFPWLPRAVKSFQEVSP